MAETVTSDPDRERVAKAIARAGLCSRREAEARIASGRVAVNGKTLDTPAFLVGPDDVITVDGKPLPAKEPTRLWRFHKVRGLVTTNRDPEGRKTVFDALGDRVPRVVTVGRLDINTEGLLLLTNDGGLARTLELPETGWLRRYRVRAFGTVVQADLDRLADGVAVDGVLYGPIEAKIDHQTGSNFWLSMALREGKNREIKNVLTHLGLAVNRLIRVSFGPFQLGDLAPGDVAEVRRSVLKDQLGKKLVALSGADFSEPTQPTKTATAKAGPRPGGRGNANKGGSRHTGPGEKKSRAAQSSGRPTAPTPGRPRRRKP